VASGRAGPDGDLTTSSQEKPAVTRKQLEAFRELFDMFLKRSGDAIDLDKFKVILASVGVKMSDSKAGRAFKSFDVNGDGKVDFSDFLTVMTDTKLFFQFFKELPDVSQFLVVHKGYVDDTIFFQMLTKVMKNQIISEDSTIKIINTGQVGRWTFDWCPSMCNKH
uniref:EF-hand domain-containing protein n=1 Tax=Callorhinchus milii TaxID=7868 RepID=A0A4W3H406_CALMI